MAIIYSYDLKTNILLTDVLLGTSTVMVGGKRKNQTKSFSIKDLGDVFNSGNTLQTVTENGNYTTHDIQIDTAEGSGIRFVDGENNYISSIYGVNGNFSFSDDILEAAFVTDGTELQTGSKTLATRQWSNTNFYPSSNPTNFVSSTFVASNFYPLNSNPAGYLTSSALTLQSVTNNGNTTTNGIIVQQNNITINGNNQISVQQGNQNSSIGIAYVGTYNNNTGSFASLYNNGYLQLGNASNFQTSISANNLSNNAVDFELPNKTIGTYILATTEDIPSVTGYVPYTGAISDVNIGSYDFYANNIYANNWYGAPIAITYGGTGSTSAAGARSNIGAGTVNSVAALTIGTSGTDLSSSVATGTTNPVITLNVPTASATNRGALSTSDWTTFNDKQSKFSFMRLVSPYTGTNSTTLQKMFNVGYSSGGAFLTTTNRTYKFRLFATLTGISTTSGTHSFGFLGTSVNSYLRYMSISSRSVTVAAVGTPSSLSSVSFGATALSPAATTTTARIQIEGVISIVSGGTLIPSFAVSVSTTPVVESGAYFEILEIGSDSVVASGDIQ